MQTATMMQMAARSLAPVVNILFSCLLMREESLSFMYW